MQPSRLGGNQAHRQAGRLVKMPWKQHLKLVSRDDVDLTVLFEVGCEPGACVFQGSVIHSAPQKVSLPVCGRCLWKRSSNTGGLSLETGLSFPPVSLWTITFLGSTPRTQCPQLSVCQNQSPAWEWGTN